MSDFKVSIVVPVYNTERYIDCCLMSLINQTLKEIEIICINDGSTDKSLSILERYSKEDKRIKIINQSNKGLAEVRNIGIFNASSNLIMFCDSDDCYVKDMCEKMYNAISKNNVDFAHCGMNIIYESDKDKKKSDEKYYSLKNTGIVELNKDICLRLDGSMCNKIFRKDLISKFKITFPTNCLYEDACFFMKYMNVSKKAYFLDEKLYNYYRRSIGIMHNTFKKTERAFDYLKIMQNYFEFLNTNNLWNDWKNFFSRQFIIYFQLAFCNIIKEKKESLFYQTKKFIKNIKLEKKDFDFYFLYEFWNTLLYYDKSIFKICSIRLGDDFLSVEKSLFGLKILKIKYTTSTKKIYILGIHFKSINNF